MKTQFRSFRGFVRKASLGGERETIRPIVGLCGPGKKTPVRIGSGSRSRWRPRTQVDSLAARVKISAVIWNLFPEYFFVSSILFLPNRNRLPKVSSDPGEVRSHQYWSSDPGVRTQGFGPRSSDPVARTQQFGPRAHPRSRSHLRTRAVLVERRGEGEP